MRERAKRRMSWTIVAVATVVGVGLMVWAARSAPSSPMVRIPVTVHVDFGESGKPPQDARLLVDAGATAKDAVSMVLPIQSGEVCCNTREVAIIDGVRAEQSTKRWWVCRLNGSKRVNPFGTALKAGDRVEWRYVTGS